jgi:hypothetical protein
MEHQDYSSPRHLQGEHIIRVPLSTGLVRCCELVADTPAAMGSPWNGVNRNLFEILQIIKLPAVGAWML